MAVQKYNHTSQAQKRDARTHMAHTFQYGFCMHMHTCDGTLHMCMLARTFATHPLDISTYMLSFRFLVKISGKVTLETLCSYCVRTAIQVTYH